MGKGNRSRLNHATEVLSEASKGTAKPKTNRKAVTIIVSCLVALLLVSCIVLSYVVSSGVIVRSKTALKSDNYKINGSILTYLFYAQYQNFLSYYGQYASYFGLDTSKSLKLQDYSDDMTWYDYFMDATATQLKQIVALNEAARAEGMTLDENDKKEVEADLDVLRQYAKDNSVSVSTFLAQRFGTGVTLNDIRTATEMSKLAAKYQEKLQDEFKKAITDEDIDKYVDENKASFITSDVLKYTFKAELTTEGAEATDEEKAAYETDKTDMSAKADALKAAAVSEDGYKNWLRDYLCGDPASTAFDDSYAEESKALADADKPSAEVLAKAKEDTIAYLKDSIDGKEGAAAPTWPDAAYADVLGKVITSVFAKIVTNGYNTAVSNGITWSDPAAEDASELNKWLFNAERKAGDTFIDKTEGDSSSTYTVYYITNAFKKNEDRTVNVAHILVTAEKAGYDESDTEKTNKASEAAKAKAEQLLAEFKAGTPTLDAFKTLGEANTEDSNVLYENVQKDYMVEAFDEWIFDEARVEGDTGIVKTDYGYHVMYFAGEGLPVWKSNATDGVLDKKLSDWYEEAAEKYHITCDTSKLTYVNA